jgi:hypothetical protein
MIRRRESGQITGNLNTAREFHSATLLRNGKVLVAGGGNEDDFYPDLTNSELYDPNTGGWSVTGSLNTGRRWDTATILADGSVLAAGGWSFPCSGGYCYSTVTDSAELYNPAAGTWTYTGSSTRRSSHSATLLLSGQVLVAGGDNYAFDSSYTQATLASSEIYDTGAGAWRSTGKLNTARHSHTATLLQNGDVLVAGGGSGLDNEILGSAELYDPNAPTPAPSITGASVEGKKLIVSGENFDPGAVILLNGEEQKTISDEQNPKILIAKKAGKKVNTGDKLQVRNPNGSLSQEFTFAS